MKDLFKGRLTILHPIGWSLMLIEWWIKPGLVVSCHWVPRHTFHFWCHSNGAVKGKDNCLDLNFHILGFFFAYTDFNYGRFKKGGAK